MAASVRKSLRVQITDTVPIEFEDDDGVLERIRIDRS